MGIGFEHEKKGDFLDEVSNSNNNKLYYFGATSNFPHHHNQLELFGYGIETSNTPNIGGNSNFNNENISLLSKNYFDIDYNIKNRN